jgi:hypothetical protein
MRGFLSLATMEKPLKRFEATLKRNLRLAARDFFAFGAFELEISKQKIKKCNKKSEK